MTDKAWNAVISHVLTLPKHQEYIVQKSDYPQLPYVAELRIGFPTNIQHYNIPVGDGRAVHIKEHADHYSVHWDAADPNRDPIGHLIKDAPAETLVGLFIADQLLLDGKGTKWVLKKL